MNSDRENLSKIRSELAAFVGENEVRQAHRVAPLLDVSVVIAATAAFVAVFFSFDLIRTNYPMVVLVTLVQGWLITVLGLISHDLFVHRDFARSSKLKALSFALFLPATNSLTSYKIGHLRHHKHLGGTADTEEYKQSLNSHLKRVFFATALGYKVLRSGVHTTEISSGYKNLIEATKAEQTAVSFEKAAVLAFLFAMLLITVFYDWQLVVFTYWLPMLVVAPIINSLRIIIEHANIDPKNEYSFGTPYRTGLFSRFLFFADSGDCHLVHHIYPRIPWYRMSRFLKLSRPFFESKGIVYIDSYSALLAGWFIRNYPHRTKWPS